MPTYDFLCGDCENKFEALVRGRSVKISCPKCNSKKVQKQISSFRLNLGAPEAASSFPT